MGDNISIRRFSIVEAALLIILAMLASHVLGVIRQTLFNAMFGTGPAANAYYAASRLPDALFNLITGGALTHAFIPVFLSYEKDHGQRESWRLASLIFNILLVVLALLALIGELFTPQFVNTLIVPGYSPTEQALTTSLTRVMLFQPVILGLGTIVTSILNSRRQFLLPAVAVAIYNFGLIGGLVVSLIVPKVGVYGPTYGLLAASLLQVLIQVPALLKQEVQYSFLWNLRHPGLHELLRLLGPNVLGVATASAGIVVDTAFVSYFPDRASLAALHNASLLQALPVLLLSQAIGQALLPDLTAQATSGRYVRMCLTGIRVIGVSLLLTLPTSVALWLFGKPLIHLLFQHGAFDQHSSDLTNLALIGYALGLPAVVAVDLIARGFFALKDTHTPFFIGLFSLAMRYGLLLLLLHMLSQRFMILSIPLATAGAGTTETLLLGLILFFLLRARVKADKGMQRLQRRRLSQVNNSS
ncbi:MAG: murein biosynthesis integral membrane protein MurJ [Ktedonobacteraceae bacterium]|nr:murein biosynthesis integral membrane protein MurJ [Ktedonobacteraceae bacterium]